MHAKHVLTILAVDDLPRPKAFYSLFDWPLAVDVPVYAEFALANGVRLGVYERHGFGENMGQVPGRLAPGELAPTELYFHVDDIEVAAQRLKRAGARELSPRQPRDWGDEAAYFADPEGNVVVLARPLGLSKDRPRRMNEPNEELLKEHLAAENAHDLDRIMATYSMSPVIELNGACLVGLEAVREFHRSFGFGGGEASFSDVRVAERRRYDPTEAIIIEQTLSATHTGTWRGMQPTGRSFSISVCTVYLFEEGRLAAEHVYLDEGRLRSLLTKNV